MLFQNIWPLFFLILIPIIIFLYLLKQKAADKDFSSNLLWKEIYKNIEAKSPFEKLKYNILMYLQILLILLLIVALMTPVIKNAGKAGKNIVLVMDNSASMNYMYDSKNTRMDKAKKQAFEYIDSLADNDIVTLVKCDNTSEVEYQGSDKATLKKRIKDMEITNTAGNLSYCNELVKAFVKDMSGVTVVCYTDTEFDADSLIENNDKAGLIVYSLYSKGENCSVDYINYSVEDNVIKTLCSVTNHGDSLVTQDLSLYADEQLLDVEAVTLEAGERLNVYFKDIEMTSSAMPVLTAELSKSDSLALDNEQSIQVSDLSAKKILLVSEGNVFLEKALAPNDKYEIYKTDDIDAVLQSSEKFDLYVFDKIAVTDDELSDILSKDEAAGVIFWNYEKISIGEGGFESNGVVNEKLLKFDDSDITKYIEDFSFGITKAYTYKLPEWGRDIIKTSDGGIAAFYGNYNGRRIGVIGFDIHDTDFALKTEFPIFIAQLEEYILGDAGNTAYIDNFPSLEESDVAAASEVNVKGTGLLKISGGKNIRNLLLVFVLILMLIEWIVYIKQVHTNKKLQYLIIRCIVVVMIILAMAGISISKKGKNTENIFLIDMSDSIGGNTDEIMEYVKKQVSELPKDNKYAIVLFGKDAACCQFLTDKEELTTFSANVITSATNIEGALQSASGLFGEDAYKRLILITDGNENEGDMNQAAKLLKGSNIEFYGIEVETSFGTDAEVYIDDLIVPSVIHEGDNYNVTVEVVSNVETDAVLTLYLGRNINGRQDIHVNKGVNKFVFADKGTAGTIASYKAVIEPYDDTEYVNNTYVTYSKIDARPRILVIEGTSGEGAELEKILKAINIDYDIVSAKGAPSTVSELNAYKAIISIDVYLDDLKRDFLNSLNSYVKDYAGGYICIGGENSYALGGYRDTVLEEVLPVYMDLQGEKEIPKLSMVMVIDRSGSMDAPAVDDSQVTCLTLAKRAAVSAVKELRSSDEAGVLAFSDRYNWVVPLQDISDKTALQEDIQTIGGGGGTSIYPALEEAYKASVDSNAQLKHIILLTDGQDEFNTGYEELYEKLNSAGITVSTVAVGYDADKNTLSEIAKACGGRYYYTDVNVSIPRIFAQEVYLATNTYLVNDEFYPNITSNNKITEGVFDEGIPMMYGYVATTPKQTADVILESAKGDPVLSTWQYGLGKTIAWCSDATNEWTAEFAAWENYPLLWSNIINYVITDTNTGDEYVSVSDLGNVADISFETKEYDENTKVTAVITDDEGESFETELNPMKPGTFSSQVDLSDVGVYSINVRKKSGDEILSSYNTAFASQYSREYRFYNSTASLEGLCNQVGGQLVTLDDDIWSYKQNNVRVKKSLTIMFLLLALVFMMLDIAIRRLALDPVLYIKNSVSKVLSFLSIRKKLSEEVLADKAAGHKLSKQLETDNKADNKAGGDIDNSRDSIAEVDNKAEATQPASLDMAALLKKKKDRE